MLENSIEIIIIMIITSACLDKTLKSQYGLIREKLDNHISDSAKVCRLSDVSKVGYISSVKVCPVGKGYSGIRLIRYYDNRLVRRKFYAAGCDSYRCCVNGKGDYYIVIEIRRRRCDSIIYRLSCRYMVVVAGRVYSRHYLRLLYCVRIICVVDFPE